MEPQNAATLPPQMNALPTRRPTFLTVLCILSFVGIGLSFLGGLYNIVIYSGDTAINRLEDANRLLQDTNNPFGNFFENPSQFASSMVNMSLVNMVTALICLAGVLLMWKLRKMGFFIYFFGEIAYPVAALILSGSAGLGAGFFASLIIVGIMLSAVFSIAFIIMYAVNLKHLK